MALKYVSRCVVMMNGTKIDCLKNFKKGETVYRNEVDLMDGAGSVEVARKYKFSFDYAVPKKNARDDWGTVQDATVTIEFEGGKRITYSGVDCLAEGESTMDGQQEMVVPLTFIAGSKDGD